MALSNIFREPRREITESAVGMFVGCGFVGAIGFSDYWVATWFYQATGSEHGGCPVPLGMVLGLMTLVVLSPVIFLFVFLTHELGDAICNGLDQLGLRLRPINRPGRRP